MGISNFQFVTMVNSGISLLMGFYMLFLRRSTKEKGAAYWASGSLVIGIGLLFSLIFQLDGYFLAVIPLVFITTGLYLYLAGIWEIKEKRICKWIVIGGPVLDMLQSIVFYSIFHSYQIQRGIHLFFIVIYCILAIYEMLTLTTSQKHFRNIFRLNAFAFFIFLILILLNLKYIASNPDYNPLNNTEAGIIFNILSGFIMIVLTFGFLSAVNIQLSMELKGQLETKNKFFTIIAHDLRGPIGNITSFLDLLNDTSNLTEKDRRNYLEILKTLSQSTFHLLQNLLDWATKSKNLNKYANERIELNQIVLNNIDFFKSSATLKSINLEFKQGQNFFIEGNANMLQTIVRNLISNAVKFTSKGGSVIITTQLKANIVTLIVSDTGSGIEPESLKSLFKFEENKSSKGTSGEVGFGFGLVLCKEFVEQNKGNIRIESQVGVGTEVIVEFPLLK